MSSNTTDITKKPDALKNSKLWCDMVEEEDQQKQQQQQHSEGESSSSAQDHASSSNNNDETDSANSSVDDLQIICDSNIGQSNKKVENALPPPGLADRKPSARPAVLNPTNLGSNHSQVTLYIGNLPPSATQHEIRKLLGGYGTIVDVRIPPSKRIYDNGNHFGNMGFAFVDFSNVDEKDRALRMVNDPETPHSIDKNQITAEIPVNARRSFPSSSSSRGGAIAGAVSVPVSNNSARPKASAVPIAPSHSQANHTGSYASAVAISAGTNNHNKTAVAATQPVAAAAPSKKSSRKSRSAERATQPPAPEKLVQQAVAPSVAAAQKFQGNHKDQPVKIQIVPAQAEAAAPVPASKTEAASTSNGQNNHNNKISIDHLADNLNTLNNMKILLFDLERTYNRDLESSGISPADVQQHLRTRK